MQNQQEALANDRSDQEKILLMKYLGFDCNFFCWRGFHSTGTMRFKGEGTGAIMSLLSAIFYNSKYFGLNRPVFAFDSRKNFRKEVFPGYKDREPKDQSGKDDRKEIFRQITLLRTTILPTIGFKNIFQQTGIEADDILAILVRNNPGQFVILSGDEDLLQLTDDCSWYSPASKTLINEKEFRKKYGIAPRDWRLVKQIAGCTSDKIPGCKGVGEKYAIQYIKGELKETSKAFQSIQEGKETIAFNRRLVAIPHRKTKPIEIMEDEFSRDGFLAICDLYGFERLASQVDEWEGMFHW